MGSTTIIYQYAQVYYVNVTTCDLAIINTTKVFTYRNTYNQ